MRPGQRRGERHGPAGERLGKTDDVRVKGAIGVVELATPFDLEKLKRRFLELGVFIRPFGRIIYLTPAFTIEPEDLQHLTQAVVKATSEMA